jgi:hypothetical protein
VHENLIFVENVVLGSLFDEAKKKGTDVPVLVRNWWFLLKVSK